MNTKTRTRKGQMNTGQKNEKGQEIELSFLLRQLEVNGQRTLELGQRKVKGIW